VGFGSLRQGRLKGGGVIRKGVGEVEQYIRKKVGLGKGGHQNLKGCLYISKLDLNKRGVVGGGGGGGGKTPFVP